MPTTTPRKPTSTVNRRRADYNSGSNRYTNYQTRSNAARAYEYTPTYTPGRTYTPVAQPKPQTKAETQKAVQKTGTKSKQKAMLFKIFVRVACVFAMCCVMIYGYSAILESNNEITKLTNELAELESEKQIIQSKIDRGLELGALEEYARTQLGMVYPDKSQVFYIDMQLGDTVENKEKAVRSIGRNALQGVPGALVHAIQVLK